MSATIRILARIENLECEAPELDWINSRVRFFGEHFGMASRSIQNLLNDGSMVVVRIVPAVVS